MRTAQTQMASRRLMMPRMRSRAVEHPRKEPDAGTENATFWRFGLLFAAGYFPGIWLGRNGVSELGRQLAAYYAKISDETTFAVAFGTRFSVSFLQLTAVFLCGFCVWGVVLLTLLFAARGAFLGFCAASVAAMNGAEGLIQYRVVTAISDTAVLFLCLWLAGWSAQLATELFHAVQGRLARGTPSALRRLVMRFGIALMLAAVANAAEVLLSFVIRGLGR